MLLFSYKIGFTRKSVGKRDGHSETCEKEKKIELSSQILISFVDFSVKNFAIIWMLHIANEF